MSKRDRLKHILNSDFARSGALVFVAVIVANAFNYIFHFTVSRWLGPQQYGVISSTISIVAVVSVPSVILSMVVLKYAAELAAVQDLPKLRTLVERVFVIACAIAVVIVAGFCIGSSAIARYLRIDDPGVIVLAGFILAAVIVLVVVRAVLQGIQDFRSYAAAIILEGAGKAFFSVLLVGLGFGVRGALLGYFIATFVSFAYTAVMVRRSVGAQRGVLQVDYRRLMRVFGGVAGSTIAVTLLSYIDVVLVKHFFAPTAAGIYSAVALAGKVLLFVLGILPTVLLPKATSHTARGESAIGIFAQAFGMAVLVSLGGLLVLGLVPRLVMEVMAGKAFIAAAPYLFEYGVAMAFLGITLVVVAFKIAVHQFDYVIGLLIVVVGEMAAIFLVHDSLRHVIHILLIGNAIGLLQSLYGLATVSEYKKILGLDGRNVEAA